MGTLRAEELRSSRTATLRTACLFAGPGGLELGASWAGARLVAAVEADRSAAATLESNLPELSGRVVVGDVRAVLPEDLSALAGSVDLLLAAPPAGLSKAAYWRGRSSRLGDGLKLTDAFCAHLAALRPAWFAYVTVPALRYNQPASRQLWARLTEGIRAAGYRLDARTLDAADFGVPQHRQRVVILGARAGLELPLFPEPTHAAVGQRSLTTEGLPDYVSSREALAGVHGPPEDDEEVTGRWGHLLPAIPPGSNYQYFATERDGHPPVFLWRSRFWSFLLKIDPDRPSPTISAQPGPYTGPFHWESRRLRLRELARLFGFPDDYGFVGTRASVRAQIGSAVPPPLAAALVAEVAAVASRLRNQTSHAAHEAPA